MESVHRRRLVRELAALPEEERRVVVQEADTEASESERSPRRRPTLPWSSLRAVIGIVRGEPADAVEDTGHLYDG
ncbi:MAG TPA: hypothetical protein VJT73_10095 [Polyangiaceae bacterium]|nr:hypothetical protein [Polyangiaceae bacterium]